MSRKCYFTSARSLCSESIHLVGGTWKLSRKGKTCNLGHQMGLGGGGGVLDGRAGPS